MKHLVWLAVPLTATVASTALAGGYFSGEKGARVAGRAGAVTAKADDIMAVQYNPAGLSDVGTTLIQVGNRFSYNAYSFTRKPTLDWGTLENGVPPYVTFDEVENDTPWQVLDPLVGVATNFGLNDWGFAFAVYAPPGIAHERYPEDGGQRYMMVEREAIILNYSLSAAWQYRKTFGVGASLQWIAVPKLRYSLVVDGHGMGNDDAYPVSSPYDLRATVDGKDLFTPNAILGAWYKPAEFLEIGVSGQVIPASIETASTLDLDPLSTGITEDVVLTRDGKEANDVSLELPLPMTARLGVRYIHLQNGRELFDVELDVSYETWSRVESFKIDSNELVANLLGQRVDVGNIEVEKEWQDTITVQLGGDYAVVPNLVTARGGVFYESAVAPDAYANVDFVGGEQLGAALGGSVFVDRFEVAVAYGFRVQPTVSVTEKESRVYQETPASLCDAPYTGDNCHPAYRGRPGPPANAGTYRAHSHVASLDVLYRF
ncbi:MAG TPA: outer membrane protein transport protein [Polyangiaceae bacterium]